MGGAKVLKSISQRVLSRQHVIILGINFFLELCKPFLLGLILLCLYVSVKVSTSNGQQSIFASANSTEGLR